jgi:hypothetical protein
MCARGYDFISSREMELCADSAVLLGTLCACANTIYEPELYAPGAICIYASARPPDRSIGRSGDPSCGRWPVGSEDARHAVPRGATRCQKFC